MLRKDKEQVVTELAERLRSSQTLILADYRGLSVSELDEVRTKLLEHGARFHVVKNTLTKLAADEAGFETLKELLDGPTAIAFVGDGDMVSVAKTLSETARKTRSSSSREASSRARRWTRPGGRAGQAPARRRAARPGAGRDRRAADRDRQPLRRPVQDFVGLLDARIEQLGDDAPAAEAEPAEEEAPAEEERAEEAEAAADETPQEETTEDTSEETQEEK